MLGWHWVWVPYGGSDVIRRVRTRPASDKRLYIRLYGETMFLDGPHYRSIMPITLTEAEMPNEYKGYLTSNPHRADRVISRKEGN